MARGIDLRSLLDAVEASRPASSVRELERRRVVRGWRTPSIELVLDACAKAQHVVFFWEADAAPEWGTADYWRMQYYRGGEAKKENNRRQASKWRDKVRQQWQRYCAAYAERWPDTKPIGFDRWSRYSYQEWMNDPESVLAKENVRKGWSVAPIHPGAWSAA